MPASSSCRVLPLHAVCSCYPPKTLCHKPYSAVVKCCHGFNLPVACAPVRSEIPLIIIGRQTRAALSLHPVSRRYRYVDIKISLCDLNAKSQSGQWSSLMFDNLFGSKTAKRDDREVFAALKQAASE